MTKAESEILARAIQNGAYHSLDFVGLEEIPNGWAIRIGYGGPRMVYREPDNSKYPGRIHRLQPGLGKIDSMEEWNDIQDILSKGINAEFIAR